MAVICGTGEYSFCKMCILRKVVVILTVLFGVIGFSFGDSPKNCDLVSKDFERIVKLSHLKILEKPETGKNLLTFAKGIIYYLFSYFDCVLNG